MEDWILKDKMRILNLYAGIGGNRKLWGDEHEVTAVENNPDIAETYNKLFPNDKVIVTDSLKYLMENYREFDFIWASPSCTTHSKIRFLSSKAGCYKVELPDMKLYELILFLKHYFEGLWVVENVVPYYSPLIKPTIKLGRHLFWSNFNISNKDFNEPKHNDIKGKSKEYGIELDKIKTKHRKDVLIRNMVNPEIALHILKEGQKVTLKPSQ